MSRRTVLRASMLHAPLLVASVVLIASCRYSGSHDGDASAARSSKKKSDTTELTLLWERDNFGGKKIRQLFHDDSLVYVITADDAVHAIGTDGVHRWISHDLDGQATGMASNVWGVAFLVGSDVYVFDRALGRLTLKKRLPVPPSATPVMTDSTLFVPSFVGNRIYTFDLDTGLRGWSFTTAAGVEAQPVIVGDPARQNVVYAGIGGELTAVAAADARAVPPEGASWSRATHDANSADLVSDGNRYVYVASEDTELYALDRITGEVQWTYPTGSRLEHEPILTAGHVFQFAGDELLALDPETGSLRWTLEHEVDPEGAFVAEAGGRLYVYAPNVGLHEVDPATGRQVREIAFDPGARHLAFDAANLVLVARGDTLFAYAL